MTRVGISIAWLAALYGCSGTHDRNLASRQGESRSPGLVRQKTTGLTRLKDTAQSRPPPMNRVRLGAVPTPRRTSRKANDSVAAYAPAVERDTGVGEVANSPTVVDSVTPNVDTTDSATPSVDTMDSVTPNVETADSVMPNADTAMTRDTQSVNPPPVNPGISPSPASDSLPASASANMLPVGTEIPAALEDSLNSRHDTAGKLVTARVMNDVKGPDDRIFIPAGSQVRLTVTRLEPARSKSAADGKIAVRVDGIVIGDRLQRVSANVRPIPHELRGRGVTTGDAAKVGVGAAGGAVLGKVIGKNTKGAVIGGVVGAAGGAVVASQTASRDVVVTARTPFTFVLTAPLVSPR